MKADIDPDDVFKRKADHRGRISLPASEFKDKKLEIAILDEIEKDTGENNQSKS